jgi:hypothetical protein
VPAYYAYYDKSQKNYEILPTLIAKGTSTYQNNKKKIINQPISIVE